MEELSLNTHQPYRLTNPLLTENSNRRRQNPYLILCSLTQESHDRLLVLKSWVVTDFILFKHGKHGMGDVSNTYMIDLIKHASLHYTYIHASYVKCVKVNMQWLWPDPMWSFQANEKIKVNLW